MKTFAALAVLAALGFGMFNMVAGPFKASTDKLVSSLKTK